MEETVVQQVRKHIQEKYTILTSPLDAADEDLDAEPTFDRHFWQNFLPQAAADYVYTKLWATDHSLLLAQDFYEMEFAFRAWFDGSTLDKFIVAAIAGHLAELRRFHDILDVVDAFAQQQGTFDPPYPARQPEISIPAIAQKVLALLPPRTMRDVLAQIRSEHLES